MIWNYLFVYLVLGLISTIGGMFTRTFQGGLKQRVFYILSCLVLWPFWSAIDVVFELRRFFYSARCPWCGERVNYKEPKEIQWHVERCQKHPMLNEIARLNRKMAMYDKMIFMWSSGEDEHSK